MANLLEKFNPIKAILLDVDGVLTDGSVTLVPGGEQVRKMHTKDGYILQLAVKKAYEIAIITGGKSQDVKRRLNGLGIEKVYLSSSNKLAVFEEFLIETDLTPEECMYMGDDIPDYEVMQKVGLACCPADACEEIKRIAHYITQANGGEGAVREVVEKVMKIQNNWFEPNDNKPLGDFTW